jgi:hypothetical protein
LGGVARLPPDHREIATFGAHFNCCGHKHRWPIEKPIAQHKPWTTFVELTRRWKRWKCGPRDVVLFAIGR